MEQKIPPNGKNGTIGWNCPKHRVMYADTSPLIDRFVTIEHGIGFDAVLQEDFLDGPLMQGRDANSLLLHAIELRLSYLEDDIILDVLGLGKRKLIEQLAHAKRIEYRCIAHIFLTLCGTTDESRIKHLQRTLVGRKETGGLIAQA